jgi:hypothetical protein
MSESFEHDPIARRLVIALDALPVPEEPNVLSAMAKPSFLRDTRIFLAAALVLVLVATLTSPQFQQTAAELTRYIDRMIVGPGDWVGYYHDHTARDVDGRPAVRLLVASGTAQGVPTTPDTVGGLVHHGPWSPDREQFALSHGGKLYVGDEYGRLRPIADVGPGYVVVPLGWVGNDRLWATVSATPGAASQSSLVTVDLKTGSLEYHRPDNLPGGLGRISPEGRWVGVFFGPPDGTPRCGFIRAVYDLVNGQAIDVVDANGQLASGYGFLSDGRIVIGQCDRTAGTLELYVGAPGARPSLIAVVPISVPRPVVAWGDGSDEIHVIASAPEAPQSAYVFDPAGRLLRMTPLPKLALAGEIWAGLSRDGRFMSFDGSALVGGAPRTGVIDLTTGHVTYLCDADCDYLYLR